jgi:hypothetical protein
LRSRADRFLPWDRRVSLAIVLAREENVELAREQTQRSLDAITEENIRTLTPGMLLNFQRLIRAFGLEIENAHLRALAGELLPRVLRVHLEE